MKQAKRPARGVYNQGMSKNDPRLAYLKEQRKHRAQQATSTEEEDAKQARQ